MNHTFGKSESLFCTLCHTFDVDAEEGSLSCSHAVCICHDIGLASCTHICNDTTVHGKYIDGLHHFPLAQADDQQMVSEADTRLLSVLSIWVALSYARWVGGLR